MPFNDTAGLVLAAARRNLGDAPVAVELFYQTLDVSDAILDHLASDAHVKQPVMAELRALTHLQRKPKIKRFYDLLGFTDWVAIDSYTEHENLVMDLNRVLSREYGFDRTFDFVSNKGATEHVFDQRATFENIHNLCKVGGVMVHDIPTINIFNHAFYGYHPLFLVELAAANHYEILDLRLANRWGDTVQVRLRPSDPEPVIDYMPSLLGADLVLPPFIELADFIAKTAIGVSDCPLSRVYQKLAQRGLKRRSNNPGEIFICGILRKTAAHPFQVPYQGKFLSFIQTDEFRERYRNQLSS
jgi:SAM-dependent methyltransferase